MKISDEGLRLAANLEAHYDAWLEAARTLESEGRLAWKTSANREYLYSFINRRNDGKSLGPRSAETEDLMARHQAARTAAAQIWERLRTDGSIYRALRLPRIPSYAAEVLRHLDLARLLGGSVLVIGTNALAAYAIEAGELFPSELDATDDFDLTWVRPSAVPAPTASTPSVFGILKDVDETYTINMERTFQARNARGNEVELLIAQELAGALPRFERFQPVPLPEQDWLLPGTRVSHVVCGYDALPARVVAPDPRWFALHKLWLSEKPARNPLKRSKDRRQGMVLLDLIAAAMPRFPIDDDFEASLPDELRVHLACWKKKLKN